MKNLTILTGRNMTDLEDLYSLYANFVALERMGFSLPNWTANIYPKGKLYDAMILNLRIQNYNNLIKRIHGGNVFIYIYPTNKYIFRISILFLNFQVDLYEQ